jgi:hypothetical protein
MMIFFIFCYFLLFLSVSFQTGPWTTGPWTCGPFTVHAIKMDYKIRTYWTNGLVQLGLFLHHK